MNQRRISLDSSSSSARDRVLASGGGGGGAGGSVQAMRAAARRGRMSVDLSLLLGGGPGRSADEEGLSARCPNLARCEAEQQARQQQQQQQQQP